MKTKLGDILSYEYQQFHPLVRRDVYVMLFVKTATSVYRDIKDNSAVGCVNSVAKTLSKDGAIAFLILTVADLGDDMAVTQLY